MEVGVRAKSWRCSSGGSRRHIISAVTRWAAVTGLLAGVMFLVAGTTRITMLWAYLAVFSVLLLVTMLAVDPELAQERAHSGREQTIQGGAVAPDFFFLLPWASQRWTRAGYINRAECPFR